jgi:cell division protein ZapB
MTKDLLLKLEQKVEHAVEVIELLRLQLDELEQENRALKVEHDKWRSDLTAMINRLEGIDTTSNSSSEENFENADQSMEEVVTEEDYIA